MINANDRSVSQWLSLRAAVLLLWALVVGVAGAVLLYAAGRSLAEAVIGGFIATGSSLPLLTNLVGG